MFIRIGTPFEDNTTLYLFVYRDDNKYYFQKIKHYASFKGSPLFEYGNTSIQIYEYSRIFKTVKNIEEFISNDCKRCQNAEIIILTKNKNNKVKTDNKVIQLT